MASIYKPVSQADGEDDIELSTVVRSEYIIAIPKSQSTFQSSQSSINIPLKSNYLKKIIGIFLSFITLLMVIFVSWFIIWYSSIDFS